MGRSKMKFFIIKFMFNQNIANNMWYYVVTSAMESSFDDIVWATALVLVQLVK